MGERDLARLESVFLVTESNPSYALESNQRFYINTTITNGYGIDSSKPYFRIEINVLKFFSAESADNYYNLFCLSLWVSMGRSWRGGDGMKQIVENMIRTVSPIESPTKLI